jgi:hypothetical protein
MTVRTFKLYPDERHWWSFADYGAVLDTMEQRRPARVLEFGPGSSTLALIEGGASHIDTCEDNPDWATVYEDRLVRKFLGQVFLHRFAWADPLSIPSIDDQRYDLALIDGPLGTDSRPPVVRYAMARCDAVLVPTEDRNPSFRQTLIAMAAAAGWDIAIRETGPLSGGFALMTPRTMEAWDGSEATPFRLPADHAERPSIVTAAPKRRGRRVKGTK